MDFYLNNKRKRFESNNVSIFYQNKPFQNKDILVDGIWKCCFDKNFFQQGVSYESSFNDFRFKIPIKIGLKIINDYVFQIKLAIGPQKNVISNEGIYSNEFEDKKYYVELSIELKNVISEKFSFSQNQGELIKQMIRLNENQKILLRKYHSNEKCFYVQIKIKYNGQLFNNEKIEDNKYSGLKNMGATCYLNSIIQLLFSLTIFKKNVFECEISKENFRKNKIYNFQKLFYKMLKNGEEKNKEEIKTDFLMKSFGMEISDLNIQNDIQEFFLMLSENMENDLKDKNINSILEGKITTIIQCTEINYSSRKEDSFSDIQLAIDNCDNIYDCINKFTGKEELKGDNQYQTEKFGKQNAIKQTFFSKFPKVLCLQLNRFIYNNNSYEKNNKEIKYSKELDLKKYKMKDIIFEDDDFKYILHCVIVHNGSINRGHYMCYIKEENGWYLFNDNKVYKVDEFEAIDYNFGGDFEKFNLDNGVFSSKKDKNFSNAYLLIYIQKKIYHQVVFPFSIKNIPENVLNLFHIENMEIAKERYNKFFEEYFIEVNIINKYMINKFGIIDNRDDNKASNNLLKLKVHKNIVFKNLMRIISNEIAVDINDVFVYKLKETNFSFIERFNYKMEFIKREKYNYTLSQIYPIQKKGSIYLFIYIDSEKNNFIQRNNNINSKDIPINFKEDQFYNYSEDFHECINYIFYMKETKYFFKKCSSINYSNVVQEIHNNNLYDKYYLLFLKVPHFKINPYNNFYDCTNLENVDIYQLKNSETISEKLQKNQLIDKYFELYEDVLKENNISMNDLHPTYLFLYCSLSQYIKEKNLDFKYTYEIKGGSTLENFKNDGICVVLNFATFIPKLINKYLNIEYKKVEYVTFSHKNNLIKSKIYYINIEDEEYNLKKIKETIYSLLEKEENYKLFGYNREISKRIKNYFVIDPLSLNDRIKKIYNCPELYSIERKFDRPLKDKEKDEILNYINPSNNNEILYYINIQNLIYKKYSSKDSEIMEVILCDDNGNPENKFYITLSHNRAEIKYSKIQEFIFKYYFKINNLDLKSEINGSKYNLMLFDPNSLIGYELIDISNGQNLNKEIEEACLKLVNKEFILQKFYDLKKGEKIFVCIYYNDNGIEKPLYFPFISLFDFNMLYLEFRKYMIDYYSRVNYIKEKFGDIKKNNNININFYIIDVKQDHFLKKLFFQKKGLLDSKQNQNSSLGILLKDTKIKNILMLFSNKQKILKI